MLARSLAVPLAAFLLAGGVARAESSGPVFKDAERFGGARPLAPGGDPAWGGVAGAPVPFGRPATRFDGGAGYVGSDWGLGRPAYTGLGTRPDWGRSGE